MEKVLYKINHISILYFPHTENILYPLIEINIPNKWRTMDCVGMMIFYLLYSSFSHSLNMHSVQFSSVQSLSHVELFVTTPWTVAHQASLSITNSWSLLKLMSIESVMPSNHLILCCPLLLLPSIYPSIRVFTSESVLPIGWPKYWSFSRRFSPSNEYS